MISFGSPLWGLIFIAVVAIAIGYSFLLRHQSGGAAQFSQPLLRARDPLLARVRVALLLLAGFLVTVALMDPRQPLPEEGRGGAVKENWIEREGESQRALVRRKHHEVIFLVDASASMEVADTRSGVSRLDEAKEFVDEVVSRLNGQEVALYAFTAQPTRLVPATLDHLYTRFQAKRIAVNEGDTAGTDLMELLGVIRETHIKRHPSKQKTIVLLTDGGDTRLERLEGEERDQEMELLLSRLEGSESYKTRLFCIGLGSREGEIVPGVSFDGEPVSSSLDETLLMRLAEKGGGRFYLAKEQSPLAVVNDLIGEIERGEVSSLEESEIKAGVMERETSGTPTAYRSLYQYPLGLALVALLGALALPEVRRSAVALLLCMATPGVGANVEWMREHLESATGNQKATLHYNLGTIALKEDNNKEEALQHFRAALALNPEQPQLYLHAALIQLDCADSANGLNEGLLWLKRGQEIDEDEGLSEEWDSLRHLYATRIAYQQELERQKALEEADTVELLKRLREAIEAEKKAADFVKTLPKGMRNQTLARQAIGLRNQETLLKELEGRETKGDTVPVASGLQQAAEWLNEGDSERGWRALAKTAIRTELAQALEEEKHPLGLLLEREVTRRDAKLVDELIVEELDRPLPPTGEAQTDEINQGLLTLLKLQERSRAEQLAVYQQMWQSESETLTRLRTEEDALTVDALVEKLKIQREVIPEERERLDMTIRALKQGDFDAALLAWSPEGYLVAQYGDIVKELAGEEAAPLDKLGKWREAASEMESLKSLDKAAERAQGYLQAATGGETFSLLRRGAHHDMRQALEGLSDRDLPPKQRLEQALHEQEVAEELTQGLHTLGVRGPQELLEQLQTIPPRCAPGDEGVPEGVQSLVREGKMAAERAAQLLTEGKLEVLLPAEADQQVAITSWREALEKWDEEGDDSKGEGEEPPPVADGESIPQELLQLYQQMEQDDNAKGEAAGSVREGIRPW